VTGRDGDPGDDAAQALGEILTHGASLVAALAKQLTGISAIPLETDGAASRPRIQTDATTGRRELRIALPDDSTLAAWTGRILAVLASLQTRD
jgi:hypothetical protein